MTIRALAMILLGVAAAPLSAQPCPDYAYNTSSTSFDSNEVMQRINWFKQFDENEWEYARSASMNAGIPIEGIMLTLGGSADASGWQRFRRDIESFNSLSESRQTVYTQQLRTVDANAAQVMQQCLSRGGLHVWAEPSHDPRRFILVARFTPTGTVQNARIISASSEPQMECVQQFLPTAPDTTRKVIGPARFQAICVRPDSGAADVVINATEDVQEGSIRIPPVLSLALPPGPTPELEREDVATVGILRHRPRHRGGDRDFHGNGPDVSANATIQVSQDRRSVIVRLFMDAREHGGNTWASSRSDPIIIYRAPPGFQIVRIKSPRGDYDEANYRDNDHNNDTFDVRSIHRGNCPTGNSIQQRARRAACQILRRRVSNNGLVQEWSFTGDTDGDEAGTATEVRVTLNTIRVVLRGRPE